jgi:hypothetical protein
MSWFPFRLFEFTLGMTIGYLLVERRAKLQTALGSWATVAALAAAGVALHTCGSLVDDRGGYWNSFAYQLVTAGFGALVLAVLVMRAPRLLNSPPVRLIAFVGVISYQRVIPASQQVFHRRGLPVERRLVVLRHRPLRAAHHRPRVSARRHARPPPSALAHRRLTGP